MPSNYTSPEDIENMRQIIQLEKEKQVSIGPGKRNRSANKSIGKLAAKTASWALFGGMALLLVINLIMVLSARRNGEIPTLSGGFQIFVVKSGSMEPTLKVGSAILNRIAKDPQKLQQHDIVTFRTTTGDVVTHRIVSVSQDTSGHTIYRTKGDNPRNSIDSEPLTPDRVLSVFLAKIPLT